MKSAGTVQLATPTDLEVVMTRLVDAPRRLVWEAWTNPELVPRWMLGPEGWTMPVCEIDLRPSGAWHFVWRRATGTEMEMRGAYREIAAPERLVFTEKWGPEWPETTNTLTLVERGGRTTITLTILYPSKDARDAALGTGMADGIAPSFDRLEQLVGATAARTPGIARETALRLVAEPGKPTMVMTRVFDAPRRLVFEAHSRPEHIARWWGPRDQKLTACEMDFRPGGAWRFVLRAPDGREHPFKGVYREIVPPERLVYTFVYDVPGIRDHEAVETLVFEERDGRTTLTNTMVHATVEARDGHLRAGMEAGASETLERLAELLRTMDREIVISRVFDAPRELVWEAWTNPKHVVNWWGPDGFTTTIEKMDVRPGGVWQHVMHGPDGTDYPNKSVFPEVVKPERIVYSHGGGREGGPGASFEATWTFEAVEGNKTRATGRMVFSSAAEREHVVREFNAIEGGRQTLGRLAEYLARMA